MFINIYKYYIENMNDYIKIYNASTYLKNILDKTINVENKNENKNEIKIEIEIEKILNLTHKLLNLNISYNIFIEYILKLLDDYESIEYNEENILTFVTLVDYFMFEYITDIFFDFVVYKYIFKKRIFYDKLHKYNAINYCILDKFKNDDNNTENINIGSEINTSYLFIIHKNNISNEIFKYIFEINENICNEIYELQSRHIEQNLLNKCKHIIKLNICDNIKIFNINHLQKLEELDISGICEVNQKGINQLKLVRKLKYIIMKK